LRFSKLFWLLYLWWLFFARLFLWGLRGLYNLSLLLIEMFRWRVSFGWFSFAFWLRGWGRLMINFWVVIERIGANWLDLWLIWFMNVQQLWKILLQRSWKMFFHFFQRYCKPLVFSNKMNDEANLVSLSLEYCLNRVN